MTEREFIVESGMGASATAMELAGFPELIRCRKCNKSCLEEGKINGFWCRKRREWHDGDWYCADGERRT